MSNEDDFEGSNESGEDFSASEDEWKPEVQPPSSTETESDVENTASPEAPTKNKQSTAKNVRRTVTSRSSGSLRAKMFNRYKPPPKTLNQSTSKSISSNLSQVLESSRFKKKKSIRSSQNSSKDSDSSGDDYLVNPNELDLQSSFFDVKSKPIIVEKPPEFDCNAGLHLSDSEEEDFEEVEQSSNNDAKTNSNLSRLCDYAQKLESAKEHLKELSKVTPKKETELDVTQLLALGEAKASGSRGETSVKRKRIADSDSDWEEVKDLNLTSVNKEGIQVIVSVNQDKSRDKRTVDADIVLKRKLNRIIRENQIYLHKISLLCHIAHGIYSNKALNNPTLMSQALKLLPNKTCYPNGRTEIKYFESLVKWFKTAVCVKSDKMYPYFRTRPPLPVSLAIQIKYKTAICKKDCVLIFITLLRAMGIQCRMVLNLVPLPLKPAQSDLCKLHPPKEDNSKSAETKSAKSKEKIKAENKQTAIQIDGAENTATKVSKRGQSSNVKTKDQEKLPTAEIVKDDQSIKEAKTKEKPENSGIVKEIQSKKKVHMPKETIKVEEKPIRSSSRVKKKQKVEVFDNDEKIQQNGVQEIAKKQSNSKARRDKNTKNSKNTNQYTTSGEQPVKKLVRKVTSSKTPAKEKETSPHFSTKDVNTENVTKITLSKSKSRPSRQKPKNKENLAGGDLVVPQLDGAEDIKEKPVRSSRAKKLKMPQQIVVDSDSESDFVPSPPKRARPSKAQTKKEESLKNRRVLSSDDEDTKPGRKPKVGMDIWCEVFSEAEDQWIAIDLFNCKVHSVDTIRKAATPPISYVFAWNNNNTIKDVSARYCPQWHTTTRKSRVDQEWLDEALINYVATKKNARDKKEDRELHKMHLEKPLPKTITEYKNHPLYVLERHLLKFEGIYPPNALTLGFVRGEPVYARECVHTMHSRDIWLKQARVVKLGEKPYKIVKARPKWDKFTNTVIKDLPLEIFGYWQTKKYDPPTAENGIVPRNAYGNVELFKKCMLPKKTVHLQLPGLNRVCKKLKIDCAPAVVGFDFHQGLCHPMLDGFVVCEEYAEQVVAAWHEEQKEAERREEEKYQQRVYGNWKKLIKGLLIRERLNKKYNFKNQ